jgi:hypothetical protein
MTEPSAFVLRREFVMEEIARFVVVACVVVAWSAVKFWKVEEAVARRFPKVPRPEAVRVVKPEKAPLVTSHESELMLMVSPPSPRVSEPVVVKVPEMELLPMVPPSMVMLLSIPASSREPERVGANWSVSPVPVMVRFDVSPLKAAVVVERVTVGPSAVCPAGPIAWTAAVMRPRDEVAKPS